jgi:translation initiation factor eIF-2B subunit alpha
LGKRHGGGLFLFFRVCVCVLKFAKQRITSLTGFNVTMVVDASIARVMHQIDLVVFGAEGIVENGGVINTVGTLQIAMVAAQLKVPVYRKFFFCFLFCFVLLIGCCRYVAAESFKFVRHFPLSQEDVPEGAKVQLSKELSAITSERIEVLKHTHDYCPPKFLTLLFTDLGILTPSAVSDTLIRLYL